MTSPRQRSNGLLGLCRARMAVWICAGLLFVGMIVLPSLHNLHHRDDHVHGVAGVTHAKATRGQADVHVHDDVDEHVHAHVHDDEYVHDHDEHDVAHEDDSAHEHASADEHVRTTSHRPDRDDEDAPDLGHGRGALDHFSIAITSVVPFVLPERVDVVASSSLLPPQAQRLGTFDDLPWQSRAPPMVRIFSLT